MLGLLEMTISSDSRILLVCMTIALMDVGTYKTVQLRQASTWTRYVQTAPTVLHLNVVDLRRTVSDRSELTSILFWVNEITAAIEIIPLNLMLR